MSEFPERFWHAQPVVTIEFARISWDVVLLFENQREYLDSFGTIGPASDYAHRTAEMNAIRFVPGASRGWLRRSEGGHHA